MNQLYNKNELNFALVWIAIYVGLLSVGDRISDAVGIARLVTVPLCILLTVILYRWICKNELKEKYGLCSFQGEWKQYLYFIPLVLLATTNLWRGFAVNLSRLETVLYILSMLCVGFLEEVIFRGFLFKAISRTNVKQAIFISGITFGFGHIVNLLNGRAILETSLQICYAAAIGILFAIIFYKGKSLYPCIITHSAINCLSVFAREEIQTAQMQMAASIFLCAVATGYAVYLWKKADGSRKEN